jgi:hypothetical protein
MPCWAAFSGLFPDPVFYVLIKLDEILRLGVASSRANSRWMSNNPISPVLSTTGRSRFRPKPGVPATTTSKARATGLPLRNGSPFYLVAGIDARVSHLSIRPEFRYSHFSTGPDPNAEEILKPNQFEFLLGVSVQFRLKKVDHR